MKNTANILIVDDDPGNLTTLEDIIDASGYNTFTACSGTDALKIATKEKIDLILMDFRMPGMTGLEVFHKIKEISLPPKTIFITAYFDEQKLNSEKDERILGICHKPIDVKKLIDLIKQADI